MKQATECPVCGSYRTFLFLNRTKVPVHQNLIINYQTAAVDIPRGDLKLFCCDECGFVYNGAFDPCKLSYGAAYENTQTCSPCFRDYIEGMVRYLVYEKVVRNCRIVEVGCGKGYFLRRLIEEGEGNIGYGFDPAYAGPEIELGGRLYFARNYYGPNCVNIPADVVICRHVIEHVQDPISLLHSIRSALISSPKALVFFETPCVEWILRNQVILDFFYEHCSLFSVNSLKTVLETTGFKVETVCHMFGGQYLWVEAMVAEGHNPVPISRQPSGIPELARQFGPSEITLREAWQRKLSRLLMRKKRIAIWGAGAKGVTFANLIDPKREMITCVVDLNPKKQGNYVPGTGHPIVDYRTLGNLGVTTAILMNPNYRDENRGLLRLAGLDVELVHNL